MKFFSGMARWLLYFGSRDERIQAGADKAGHVSFWFIVFCLAAYFIVLNTGTALPVGAHKRIMAFIVVISCVLYSTLWIRKGLDFFESKAQRRTLLSMIVLSPFAIGVISWIMTSGMENSVTRFLIVGGMSIGGGACLGLSYYIGIRLIRRRTGGSSMPE
jgi:uncharacterized membrane protein YbhN (UPF0104 family)